MPRDGKRWPRLQGQTTRLAITVTVSAPSATIPPISRVTPARGSTTSWVTTPRPAAQLQGVSDSLSLLAARAELFERAGDHSAEDG